MPSPRHEPDQSSPLVDHDALARLAGDDEAEAGTGDEAGAGAEADTEQDDAVDDDTDENVLAHHLRERLAEIAAQQKGRTEPIAAWDSAV